MLSFLAKHGILITGVVLQFLGAPLALLIIGMVISATVILFGMVVHAIANLPSPEEEALNQKLNSESPEYLSKYMPKV